MKGTGIFTGVPEADAVPHERKSAECGVWGAEPRESEDELLGFYCFRTPHFHSTAGGEDANKTQIKGTGMNGTNSRR
jgi:hypothetical protein